MKDVFSYFRQDDSSLLCASWKLKMQCNTIRFVFQTDYRNDFRWKFHYDELCSHFCPLDLHFTANTFSLLCFTRCGVFKTSLHLSSSLTFSSLPPSITHMHTRPTPPPRLQSVGWRAALVIAEQMSVPYW